MSIKQVKAVCCDKCGKPIFNKGILVQSGTIKLRESSKESGHPDSVSIEDVSAEKVYCTRMCLVAPPQEGPGTV